MTILIYNFNNGVFLKDNEGNKLPLTYNKSVIENLSKNSYSAANRCYFVPKIENKPFDCSLLERKSLELKPVGYELKSTGKLKPFITVEQYESITEQFKAFYKKSSEKEVITYIKETDTLDVFTFDLDYVAITDSNTQTKLQKNVSTKYSTTHLLESSLPSEINHLLSCSVSGKTVFSILSETLKDLELEKSKGTVTLYQDEITINLYSKPYNGERKQREILKQNGRPYANRQFRTVPDYPSIKSKIVYTSKSLNTVYANNLEDLTLKVEAIIESILEELK